MVQHAREISVDAEALINALVTAPSERKVAILDSCGVGHLGSHLAIAGIDPVERIEIFGDAENALSVLGQRLISDGLAAIFTLSYDFGKKLVCGNDAQEFPALEPLVSISLFDSLIEHDYRTGKTFVFGSDERSSEIESFVCSAPASIERARAKTAGCASNFTKTEYIEAIEKIREYIRCGDTYQTNLTQQMRVPLPDEIDPHDVFLRLRRDHPAPFAAYISRGDSVVVSASPERFLEVKGNSISAAPIKGTRRRGTSDIDDERLRRELLDSAKDRAENVMIVDLLRNDLGRVCEFGTVEVEQLCEIEEHPTLFHLFSSVSGTLRRNIGMADIIRAAFPCGSITGAPKIRTMDIIDEIEPDERGLSMGAIGYSIPAGSFGRSEQITEMSVAIRTMVIRNREAVFNVGGGIVIDSDPEKEFEESMLKAKALLRALGCDDSSRLSGTNR